MTFSTNDAWPLDGTWGIRCQYYRIQELSAALTALTSTVNTNSAMLSCGDTSGRRMADDNPLPAEPPLPSARAIIDEYLERHPDAAAPLDDAQLAHVKAHMEGLVAYMEHFGQPAPA